MPAPTVSRCGLAALVAALGVACAAPVARAASAPGAPGQRTTRASADKDRFGTAIGRASRVRFTLSHGSLTEVYYPRLRRSVGARFRARHGRRTPRRARDGRHRVGRLAPRGVFLRLASSIDAGRPVERPAVVACRYAGACG